MILSSDIEKNKNILENILAVDESFDIIKKTHYAYNKKLCFYFIDGFIKDEIFQRILDNFNYITKDHLNNVNDITLFCEHFLNYTEISIKTNVHDIVNCVLQGQTALIIDGFNSAVVIDLRTYPTRSIEEPDKDKVLRGSKDGFNETIVFNTALIRRRIRDEKLVFKMLSVGQKTKTDIAIGHINGISDSNLLQDIINKLQNFKSDSCLLNSQNVLEIIFGKKIINPFPKMKITERPDVASWNILEGRIILIIDNIPSVIILPTTLFDLLQEADNFYFPSLTSNYFKFLRISIFFATMFLTPIWLLLLQNQHILPDLLSFIPVKDPSPLPVILQLLIIEIGIDGLRLASLNTPSSLSSSLSVVGALILGDFAIKTGVFSAEPIFYMAFTSIATLSQTNIELGYAVKYMRIFLLFCTFLGNFIGFTVGTIIIFIFLVTNHTIGSKGYLYPIIPFNIKDFKKTFFKSSVLNK
ncbi:MAG: spore germination protein [Oscillospiraceae bacterium]